MNIKLKRLTARILLAVFVFTQCFIGFPALPTLVHAEDKKGIIFIGESHMAIGSAVVGNSLGDYTLNDNLFFIFSNDENGPKVSWLKGAALNMTKDIIDNSDVTKWSIVIQHGYGVANGSESQENYRAAWAAYSQTFKDYNISLMTIPPLPKDSDGNYIGEMANNGGAVGTAVDKKIRNFNSFMKSNSPFTVYDVTSKYSGQKAMEGSGSRWDNENIDYNHYYDSVYKSVLTDMTSKVSPKGPTTDTDTDSDSGKDTDTDTDADQGGGVTTPTINIDLSSVEDGLEQIIKYQDAANNLIGYIQQDVDGTQEYLATIASNTEQTNVLLNDIKGLMGTKGQAAVTEVYSLNNEMTDCYYKPLLQDVYMLEQFVLYDKFANAYTGFFDLNASSPNTGNAECRELEILGYDFLLQSESYNGNAYTANRVQGGISRQTAIMDIYKALGIEIQQIQLYYQPKTKAEMINSPAIKDLSWIVNDIDSSRGQTKAFVTRTNPALYADKAMKDLHMSSSDVSASTAITLGEFISLVASMMDFYGEPVISDAEMATLLQVFGGSIPTSLKGSQLSAYVYLRSRGILTDDYTVFCDNLKFDEMIEILMRVKDVDSRQNLKEIQVTMDISDKLAAAGFYPKEVSFSSGSNSVQIEKKYDYSNTVHFDYLLDKESAAFNGDNIYMPVDVQNYTASAGMAGFVNKEIVTVNGRDYYHFQILAAADNSDYFTQTQGYTGTAETFLLAEANSDHFVAIQQGGGIYTVNGAQNAVYKTSQQNFDNTLQGYVDKNRKANGLTASADVQETKSLWASIKSMFEPMTVKAAPVGEVDPQFSTGRITVGTTQQKPSTVYDYDYNSTVNVELTIHNWSNIDKTAYDPAMPSADVQQLSYVDQILWNVYNYAAVDSTTDTATIKLPESNVGLFLQSIKRIDSIETVNPAVPCVASVTGQTLASADYFIQRGLLYKPVSGKWDISKDVLVLDTKYGRVVLNQAENLVVAGTTMYRVPAGTILFTLNTDPDAVVGDILVDFRAFWGWSANIVDMTITGNGGNYAINVSDVSDTNASGNKVVDGKMLSSKTIRMNQVFDSGESANDSAIFLRSGYLSNHEMMLMSSNYALSNWEILETQAGTYLYIFYHKDAFTSLGLEPPTGFESMASKCYPYKGIDNGDWVVREVEIFRQKDTTPGHIYYDEKYGYLYNVPTIDEGFTLQGYLQGTYLLPIYQKANSAGNQNYNINVNVWGGLPYGSRPATSGTATEAIDWQGNKTAINSVSNVSMKATPAGIQAFFGNLDVNTVYKAGMSTLLDDAEAQTNIAIYYGTNYLIHDPFTNKIYLEIKSGSVFGVLVDEYYTKPSFNDNNAFYEVARWHVNASDSLMCRRYIVFDSIKRSEANNQDVKAEDKVDVRQPIIIEDDGYDNGYGDFEKFSVEWLLRKIEEGSSWVLIIAVKILPMLMVIALTLVMGFSLMKDFKLIQMIVAKTFDPIKFLTFGKKSFQEITKKQCMVSLLVGYLAFVLIADGNILKIIIWLSKILGMAARLFR